MISSSTHQRIYGDKIRSKNGKSLNFISTSIKNRAHAFSISSLLQRRTLGMSGIDNDLGIRYDDVKPRLTKVACRNCRIRKKACDGLRPSKLSHSKTCPDASINPPHCKWLFSMLIKDQFSLRVLFCKRVESAMYLHFLDSASRTPGDSPGSKW